MTDQGQSKVDEKANESVGRAVGFSALGIGFIGMGLSFDPVMAAKSVAILTTLLALTLMALAERALHKRVSETETWVLLEQHERPPREAAQQIIGGAIRYAQLRYARLSALLSIGFWAFTILMQAARSLAA